LCNWHTQKGGKTFEWSDSKTALCALDNQYLVPCDLRNRWSNCLYNNLNQGWSHIYKEEIFCEDKLANHGHSTTIVILYDYLPIFLRDEFLKDKFGVPYYRY
jgi:hypothetical protein